MRSAIRRFLLSRLYLVKWWMVAFLSAFTVWMVTRPQAELPELYKLLSPIRLTDYVYHAAGFALWSVLLQAALGPLNAVRRRLVVRVTLYVGVPYAVLCESFQLFVPTRHAEIQGAAANVIGVLVGVWLASLALRKSPKP